MPDAVRFAQIHMMQETDTFNPVPTALADFENVAMLEDDAMLTRVDPNGPIAGYFDAVGANGTDVRTIPVLRADAQSSGRLSRESLDQLCRSVGRRWILSAEVDRVERGGEMSKLIIRNIDDMVDEAVAALDAGGTRKYPLIEIEATAIVSS